MPPLCMFNPLSDDPLHNPLLAPKSSLKAHFCNALLWCVACHPWWKISWAFSYLIYTQGQQRSKSWGYNQRGRPDSCVTPISRCTLHQQLRRYNCTPPVATCVILNPATTTTQSMHHGTHRCAAGQTGTDRNNHLDNI